MDNSNLNALLRQLREQGESPPPHRPASRLRRIWDWWRWLIPHGTFFHTPLGHLVTWLGLVKKPSICGRTCGCCRVTGCLGKSDGSF